MNESLLDTIISAEPGEYLVNITSYKEVPALINLTDPDPSDEQHNTSYLIDPSQPADAIIRKPYILIETNNPLITIRIYSSRVPYFMRAINRQFHFELNNKPLSYILDYLRSHKFTTQLSYDPHYGEQYDFR